MSLDDPLVPSDPLEGAPAAERVNYETGVLLDAADFRDEQTYHRGRLAAALRALHGYGTLAGLRVRAPEAGDGELELRVEPGLALDRAGRLMELAAPWCIRLARWFEGQETAVLRSILHAPPRAPLDPCVVVDVFISARSCAAGLTPSFASGPFEGRDATTPARLAETPRLTLVPRAEGGPDPIPAPRNFWPAPDATAEERLEAVLAAWSPPGVPPPLREHVGGEDPTAALLARVAIPVTVGPEPGARPQLDLTLRTQVDNSLRPFIALPGRWQGAALDTSALIEP
ncbi:hypothetical protein P2H44_22910 [Albimonas sp. CAU 1670]|uniref:hypothetical protein n=1 Tax=Albimonas sp. CAU 1670 TaxID=3032599 RepID=UPI0023DC5D26|nr:hypothetical protein [Albimonas sp. CAU 1670]MDF2235416.1 hypothetical protein [Albimonas sp. CAU 1670]